MKKVLSIFFLTAALLLSFSKATAATSQIGFDEAIEQKKPLLVLIYATWADDAQTAVMNFNNLSNIHGDKFNYLLLDVAKPEMKAYNKKFPIGTDLPYMMMYKNKGSVMRYVSKSCVVDSACINKKTEIFGH